MILYLLWGLIFTMIYHHLMLLTNQKVELIEISFIFFGWPIILFIFVLGLINEFRK
jgi:hypothetical protein